MRVAIIDAGGANIGSVRYALERLGAETIVTGDAEVLDGCERWILPGVGAAAVAMGRLHELNLVPLLRTCPRPLLGICLGMQLLFEHSQEGDVECLGLLEGRVARLPAASGIRLPHMGWNRLHRRRASALLRGIDDGEHCYFVHGYAAPVTNDCIASSTHGEEFAAVVERGRVAGAQFHPERSAVAGARLLENFLAATTTSFPQGTPP